MATKIGFATDNTEQTEENENTTAEVTYTQSEAKTSPRRSVVQVYFSKRNMSLAYYNDQFDLHRGDTVYVDGKLEGLRGVVTDVNYNFKINLANYKRVISVVDTAVKGQFFMANSHFVTFDKSALPYSKAVTWFKAPDNGESEIVSGSDDTAITLGELSSDDFGQSAAERGHEIYIKNAVKYISVDGTKGHAIVEGNEYYDVEFEYSGGEVKALTCSCFCACNCKHEFATLLQLRETLEIIEKRYSSEYERTGYFAAIEKGTLFTFAIDKDESASFTL